MHNQIHARFARALVASSLLLAVAGGALSDDWRMFHGDPRHSGFSDFDAPHDSLLAWSYTSGDSILYSSPVVTESGKIYVGNVDKQLLALSPAGDLHWTFTAEGNFRHSTPAIAEDGTVYIGGSDGRLYAVNPDSTLKWTYTAAAPIKTSPNIAADGTIYFGSDDGKLYAIYPDSTERWTYQTGDTIRSSPAIGPDGTIFFGSMDSFLYAIWPDGSERWRAATGDRIKYCSPAVTEDGVIYFGSYDGFLYAVTAEQQFLWAYPTDHVVRSSPAVGPDGMIYVGANHKLLALTPEGTLEWDYETGGLIMSSPVYFGDDDVIGIGSDDGVFYCIHADGSLDWTFTVGHPIRSIPAPMRYGNIYVADVSGAVWSLGRLWWNEVPRREWISLDVPCQAIPNPAVGRVTFKTLGEDPIASRLLILDAAGRRVAALGSHGCKAVLWNCRDQHNRPVAAGTYFYLLTGQSEMGRITLLR
ncbi:MAG: PQQ-like beta-propeller repeat protein [Candidatus Eisenbacteria sp.]|nr:PQQ-like beta-propeller repeat protein [Candidatus Eisenbacteria bacterium]